MKLTSSGEEVEFTSGCSMEALGRRETGVLKVVELEKYGDTSQLIRRRV